MIDLLDQPRSWGGCMGDVGPSAFSVLSVINKGFNLLLQV